MSAPAVSSMIKWVVDEVVWMSMSALAVFTMELVLNGSVDEYELTSFGVWHIFFRERQKLDQMFLKISDHFFLLNLSKLLLQGLSSLENDFR